MAEMIFNFNNPCYIKDLENIQESTPWNDLREKSIAITGASGLLGSQIIDFLLFINHYYNANILIFALGRDIGKLKRRFQYAINDNNLKLIKYDLIQDYPQIATDYIIHCAGNSHPKLFAEDPVGTILGSVIGTNNLLRFAAETGSSVLLLSSGEIYGENTQEDKAMDENYSGQLNLSNSRACYTEGKRAIEALCQSYIDQYGVYATIARPCRIFGPTMTESDNKASAQFIKRALAGDNIILKSDGNQKFSYIYSADATSGLLTILLKGKKGEAYNIANEHCNIQLKEFAKVIAERAGVDIIFENTGENGGSKVTNALLDSNKLQNIGWHPKYNLTKAIDQTFKLLRCKYKK